MWLCPTCGRTFANRWQVHTCRALGDADQHFAGCDESVRRAFDAVLAVLDSLGPYEVLPQQTRIALHRRMSFAAFQPRRHWLDGHLILARTIANRRFRKVEVYSARNVLHAFRLTHPDDIDDEFATWLTEAYAVGEQRHRTR